MFKFNGFSNLAPLSFAIVWVLSSWWMLSTDPKRIVNVDWFLTFFVQSILYEVKSADVKMAEIAEWNPQHWKSKTICPRVDLFQILLKVRLDLYRQVAIIIVYWIFQLVHLFLLQNRWKSLTEVRQNALKHEIINSRVDVFRSVFCLRFWFHCPIEKL